MWGDGKGMISLNPLPVARVIFIYFVIQKINRENELTFFSAIITLLEAFWALNSSIIKSIDCIFFSKAYLMWLLFMLEI